MHSVAWLKQTTLALPAALKTFRGSTPPIAEIFAEFRRAWGEIWDRDPSCEELRRVQNGQVAWGEPVPARAWTLEAEDLQAAARLQTHGACGVDGWSGDEVSHWPLPA